MPFENHFFDAVISVNAIDHVDDFFKTASEIIRVLKPNGKIRLHVHYHIKTQTEPLELNDTIVENAFRGIQNFKKIN
jgi:SAM-dependent methyltransferase